MTKDEEFLENLSKEMTDIIADIGNLNDIIDKNLGLYMHLAEIYAQSICAASSVPADLVTIYECQSHMNEHISDILNTPKDAVHFIMSIIIPSAIALIDSEGGPNVSGIF